MTETKEKLQQLKNLVRQLLPEAGLLQTGIKGLSVALRTAPTFNQHCFYKPSAIIILQGEKQATLGAEKFCYGAGQLIVTSIDIPTVGSITRASEKEPFMAVILELDGYEINRIITGESGFPDTKVRRGMGKTTADETLLDAFLRLLSLQNKPESISVLAPLVSREIYYLLSISLLGEILRSINTLGSQNNRIAESINWLKKNFREPLKIAELAQKVNMAESSFYRHFNKVTSISPLQYQKQLRLYEAQRLMLSENFAAAEAAYNVGYESVSQFSREYKRMFGMPPKSSVNQLQTA